MTIHLNMHPSELAARASYGRLLSILAVRTHDLAGAEDALAEAFLAAVTQWPLDGVPQNPEAWLLTAARRRLVDAGRRRRTRDEKNVLLQVNVDDPADRDFFGDERLRLLFVCAHPAIDTAARTPLMLQTVLGLDAARIATALRVAPKTMGQRLWRAKAKIRDARVSFDVDPEELPARSFAVLEAIYAAYGSGWEDVAGRAAASRGLTEEAIWLARLTVRLLPDEPEARGLLALMLFAEARANARRGTDGAYVPLTEQDPSRWDPHLIAEAEAILTEAARMNRIGPLQLEAAIQSAHVDGQRSGSPDDRAVSLLYEALVCLAPTLGVRVAHAAALSKTEGPARGLDRLDAIASSSSSSAAAAAAAAAANDYQPYWSVRAHLLERVGRLDDARDAYDRAVGLAEEEGVRRWLLAKKRALGAPAHPSDAIRNGR